MAAGEKLRWKQEDIKIRGHAIECRINAEDPTTFAPSPGRIDKMHVPGGPGVRIDTHVATGSVVPASYDSMVAKVITHGATRSEALARARAALAEMQIEGVSTNIALHRALLDDPKFSLGGVSIHHLENWLEHRSSSHLCKNEAADV